MSAGAGRGLLAPGAEALSVRELCGWAPGLARVLRGLGVPFDASPDASLAFLCQEAGVEVADVLEALVARPRAQPAMVEVSSVSLRGGHDKTGAPEPVQDLCVKAGQAVALVGATGSGKSQVLADVESLATGDSPSGRVVLLDGKEPSFELRHSPAERPVAQVSQGMRFLLDLAVGEFLELHAASRGIAAPADSAVEVIDAACGLCGEPFLASTMLAALSGGQSRSLMIADAALVSRSRIIVIDEIENAGIDRRRALRLLKRRGSIAFIATHDPLLALQADLRVVLRHGAMQVLLERAGEEREAFEWLGQHEREIVRLRTALRTGRRLRAPRPANSSG
jgi:ABC-type lipoprotein export system ATPase subunit